jgi:hypothetical protein
MVELLGAASESTNIQICCVISNKASLSGHGTTFQVGAVGWLRTILVTAVRVSLHRKCCQGNTLTLRQMMSHGANGF